MKPPILFIRADATEAMGAGHVMRCMALAQCWQRLHGSVMFAMATPPPRPLRDLLKSQDFPIISIEGKPGSLDDAADTIAEGKNLGVNFMVLDGYHFHDSYQVQVKQQGLRLLVFDDNRDWQHFHADVILNQNLYAKESMYPRQSHEHYCTFLLGSEYCLLRNDFLQAEIPVAKQPAEIHHLLITLGGGDPDNYTGKVLEALQRLGSLDLEASIILGAANKNLEAVKRAAARLPFPTEIICHSNHMPALMARADLAISAGGSTFYEFCYMGLPALLTVIADNQYQLVETACEKGYALGRLDLHDTIATSQFIAATIKNQKRLQEVVRAGTSLIDGRGAERVCDQLLKKM